ncbi:MAG TPA: hypothetical protein VGF24_07140 [Vicinamibacterales bacterium]|jgi:hypothetical protein
MSFPSVLLATLIVLAQAAPAPQPFVSKISAGPSGSEANGVFVFAEERTVFSRTTDREAIVFFQWDGIPGVHRMSAMWRSPDGAVSSSAPFDYTAKERRFGAYWRFTLSPTTALGTWSIEATVDGHASGRFTFEITDSAPTRGTPSKRPLSSAELFEQLTRIFVVVQRFAATGKALDSAGAFVMGDGRLYSSMTTLDDADRIRAVMQDGTSRDLTSVLAWNRRQEWAVFAGGPAQPSLAIASGDSIKVGDRCFSIEGAPNGARVLLEVMISGQRPSADGRTLIGQFVNGGGTPGSPVVNEYGELVGLVGGATVPGATRLYDLLRFSARI